MSKSASRNRLPWLAGRWLLFGGICLCLIGLGFGTYTSIFLIQSVSAKGVIVDLDEIPDAENGNVNYAPVFTFTAEDGQTYTVRSRVASNPPSFSKGQQVKVLYRRSSPGAAKLGYFGQLWFVTLVFVGLGAAFGIPGFLLLLRERKRNMPVAKAIAAG